MSIFNFPAAVENSVNNVRLPRNEITDTSETIQKETTENSDATGTPTEIKPEVSISLSGPLSNIYSRALMIAFGKKDDSLAVESQANDEIMAKVLTSSSAESTTAYLEAHPDLKIDYAVYATGPSLVDTQALSKDIDAITTLQTQPNIREVIVSIESTPNNYTGILDSVCEGKKIKVVYSAHRVIDYIRNKS